MLVAEGVSELDAAFDELVGGQLLEAAELDDQHVAEVDLAEHGFLGLFVPQQHVAVVEEGVAVEGNGDGLPVAGVFAETVLLGVPLAQFERVDGGVGELGFPDGIVDVAEYGFYDVHGFSF